MEENKKIVWEDRDDIDYFILFNPTVGILFREGGVKWLTTENCHLVAHAPEDNTRSLLVEAQEYGDFEELSKEQYIKIEHRLNQYEEAEENLYDELQLLSEEE